MNAFVQGATAAPKSKKDAFTANGAVTRSTTGQAHLDLFSIIGSARNAQDDVVALFDKAYKADKATALRIALWARNVRGGAGERQAFRNILRRLSGVDSAVVTKLIPFVPAFGRWDDAIESLPTESKMFKQAADNLKLAIDGGDGLAAKWTPRKGSVAVALREHWGMTPKAYRKYVVGHTSVVETAMCNKEWETIEFSKIPSMASLRYQTAFARNAPKAYAKFEKALESGEATINAGVVFPHDIVTNALRGTGREAVLNAQWKSLPDYLAGREGNLLVLADTSSSMKTGIGGNITALNVSISLGLYISERQSGPFKDLVLTFNDNSDFHKVIGSNIVERTNSLARSPWGGSTNFQSSFDAILRVALKNNVPQADMPTTLIVLSDMEFNSSDGNRTNFGVAKQKFKDAGYELPQIVFWNLNGHAGNCPVKADASGTAMVSGFSSAILEAILKGDMDITIPDAPKLTPMDVMNNAIFNEVYDIAEQLV
jgi:hypothetical protein